MFCISFATSIQKKYIGFPSLNRSNTALLSQYLASWFKQISVKPFVFHFVKTCNFSDWQNKLTITINAYHYHRHMNNKNNTLHNKIQHLLIQWQWWIKSWFLFNCGMNLGKFGNCLLVFIGLRTPFRSLSCLVPESLSALLTTFVKVVKIDSNDFSESSKFMYRFPWVVTRTNNRSLSWLFTRANSRYLLQLSQLVVVY